MYTALAYLGICLGDTESLMYILAKKDSNNKKSWNLTCKILESQKKNSDPYKKKICNGTRSHKLFKKKKKKL